MSVAPTAWPNLAQHLSVYAITPQGYWERPDLAHHFGEAVSGGLTCLQYRDKSNAPYALRRMRALRLQELCTRSGVPLVINDDVELALDIGADGVHVGPLDRDLRDVVKMCVGRLFVGASASTLELALRAKDAGADYLGVGAIFDASASKPDAKQSQGIEFLTRITRHPRLQNTPIVAIGGITQTNHRMCREVGASGTATIRALLGTETPKAAARGLSPL